MESPSGGGALEKVKVRRGPWIKFPHHLSANTICCWRNLTLDRCREYFSQSFSIKMSAKSWIIECCQWNEWLYSWNIYLTWLRNGRSLQLGELVEWGSPFIFHCLLVILWIELHGILTVSNAYYADTLVIHTFIG